jgi:hypothetical protein
MERVQHDTVFEARSASQDCRIAVACAWGFKQKSRASAALRSYEAAENVVKPFG